MVNLADSAASTRSPVTARLKPAPAAVAVDGGDHHGVHPGERRQRAVQIVGDALDERARVGCRGHGLEVAARAEEPACAGDRDHLRRGGVAQRRRVGELAGQRVVHPVRGVGPVEHDAGDGSGLGERQRLEIGHGAKRYRRPNYVVARSGTDLQCQPVGRRFAQRGEVPAESQSAQRAVGDDPRLLGRADRRRRSGG